MGHSRHVIARGSEAHYDDPDLYDQTYRRRREDVRFYLQLAEELSAPSVLELGVGTGRVALALARAGYRVVGVDRMEPMLARFRSRLARERREVAARVELVRADLRRVRLRERFRLIVAPFNVLMHLYERRDWEAALARVRAHMARGGRFVFDVIHPDMRALVREPGRFYRSRPIRDPRSGQRFAYAEAFDYDPATQVQIVTAALEPLDSAGDVRLQPLAHRQMFPREIEALLHYNGFALEHLWGDFLRGPLTPESESQIVVARKRG